MYSSCPPPVVRMGIHTPSPQRIHTLSLLHDGSPSMVLDDPDIRVGERKGRSPDRLPSLFIDCITSLDRPEPEWAPAFCLLILLPFPLERKALHPVATLPQQMPQHRRTAGIQVEHIRLFSEHVAELPGHQGLRPAAHRPSALAYHHPEERNTVMHLRNADLVRMNPQTGTLRKEHQEVVLFRSNHVVPALFCKTILRQVHVLRRISQLFQIIGL